MIAFYPKNRHYSTTCLQARRYQKVDVKLPFFFNALVGLYTGSVRRSGVANRGVPRGFGSEYITPLRTLDPTSLRQCTAVPGQSARRRSSHPIDILSTTSSRLCGKRAAEIRRGKTVFGLRPTSSVFTGSVRVTALSHAKGWPLSRSFLMYQIQKEIDGYWRLVYRVADGTSPHKGSLPA